MRSATPKHLHPLLGRRMVDWVIECGAPLEPTRSSSSPHPIPPTFDGLPSRCSRSRSAPGTRCVGQAASGRRRRARALRRPPAAHGRAPRRARETHRAAAQRRPCSPSCRRTPGATAASSATKTAGSPDRRGRRCVPRELALAEVNSSIYVFRGAELWPVLERLEPAQRPGGALPHRHARLSSRQARRSRCTSRPTPPRSTVSTPEPIWRPPPPCCATGSTAPHARRRDDRRPRDDVDRAGRRARAGHGDPSVHGASRRHPGRDGRRDRAARGRRRRRGRSRRRWWARSVTFAPARCSRQGRKPARSWRSRTRASASARRCRISRTSATRTSARTRTSAPGTSPSNFSHKPGMPKGRTTIGSNVRTGVDNAFVAPVTVGDDAWIAAGSVITEDVPANALAISRARQENKEGRGGKRDD